jgi:hypothetical protein
MKVIFLDIDGVLNGYNKWTLLGWQIVSKLKLKVFKDLYKTITDPTGIHERRVKLLAVLVHATKAKVVLSSSRRNAFWNVPYEEQSKDIKKLTDLFNKYKIDVIGITPKIPDSKRDFEIIKWLAEHTKDVSNFVILDDENTFMRAFWDDERFIQTSSVPKGTMIKGRAEEDTGLKKQHVIEAIRVLKS